MKNSSHKTMKTNLRKPENRRRTGVKNAEKNQFKPGQSGNPGGRPKGISAIIRADTREGQELVDVMLSVARGKLLVGKRLPRHQDILAAIEWLADRGFGKSDQPMGCSGSVVAGFPDEYLQLFREDARKL